MAARAYIGTAGWSLPRGEQERFPVGPSHLARYAQVFDAVEINSTFHRAHRAATYERWAASVPRGFRFSVKLPKTITHEQRLAGSAKLVDAFLADVSPLGERLRCLLVQLPPSLAFAPRTARAFFARLVGRFEGVVAVEPRHASWFAPAAERMLAELRVARVAADPPRGPNGLEPGGARAVAYFRLHGSPRVYYSSYEEPFLELLAGRVQALRRSGVECWCIFDNTTLGAATGNALRLAAGMAASGRR